MNKWKKISTIAVRKKGKLSQSGHIIAESTTRDRESQSTSAQQHQKQSRRKANIRPFNKSPRGSSGNSSDYDTRCARIIMWNLQKHIHPARCFTTSSIFLSRGCIRDRERDDLNRLKIPPPDGEKRHQRVWLTKPINLVYTTGRRPDIL